MSHLLALTTAEDILVGLARGTRLGNEQQFAVHEAIRKALPVHEDGEALWQRATADYREALTQVAARLESFTAAPVGASSGLAELLWFWFGPNAWRTLVVDGGWSWDRAEDVLCRTAVAALT